MAEGSNGTMGARGMDTAHLLTDGRYRVRVDALGAGYSECAGQALTRWRGDAVENLEGFFIYLRDLDRDLLWSATARPVGRVPERAGSAFEADRAIFERLDEGILTRLEVAVLPGRDAEVRRLSLTNESQMPRRIEVTSCIEAVLNEREADAAHPAFSKLFLQTEWHEASRALVARRRPRGADEAPRWMCHWITGEGAEAVSWETDRARFLGRGRTLADPLGVHGPLSGTTGSVLDPVLVLRRVIVLKPGETRSLGFGLALAQDREDALAKCALPMAGEARGCGLREVGRPTSPRYAPRPEGKVEPGLQAPTVLDNGLGGFSPDGREYVLRIGPGVLPPMPWSNVIANEHFGFLATERGLSCAWNGNSRLHRLTPWFNDPVGDPLSEALYLRDEEERNFWSLTPGPAGSAQSFIVRHGFGYTRWIGCDQGLEQETTAFVPLHEPLQVLRIRLRNTGDRPRRLGLFWCAHLVLGETPAQTAGHVNTEREGGALFARSSLPGPFSGQVAFATLLGGGSETSFTTDRGAFLGRPGSSVAPEAVTTGEHLDGAAGPGQDPCFAFQTSVELAPGEERELCILLGEAGSGEEARRILQAYARTQDCAAAFDAVGAFWEETLSGFQVETPEPALDPMVNGWLPYQNLTCRMWGRTAYYQSGGAFGFRDQLQDAAALLYLKPDITRKQILLNAAHQFKEGDVLHWWHPPIEQGIRTRFSDDLLWLPFLTAFYIQGTGDRDILSERTPYLEARLLGEGEDEAYLEPTISGTDGDLYDHCCRALDRAAERIGVHGLPLMGTGDWNDGMNRVGRQGRGESVWMGFFLYTILEDFLPLCRHREDAARLGRYRELQRKLAQALETAGWDGEWYRRAYYDDGATLGSASDSECRIDCLAQAWAAISGAVPEARARQAMKAAEEHLIDEGVGMIRLLTPPFDTCEHDPGYIKGYIPGVRENGGQYTHGALWAVKAMAKLGEVDRAAELLRMLSPLSHAASPEAVAVYQTEPYVIAADVYGEAPHRGRGGWTWYTGSAGWMYRVAIEDVLGFQLEQGEALLLRPSLPSAWDHASLRYRDPATRTTFEIRIERNPSLPQGTHSATLDGTPLASEAGRIRIPNLRDGAVHAVRVVLGPRS